MEHSFNPLLFFVIIICITISSAAADFVENPDFEIPPANFTANGSSQPWLLTGENTVPGWSHNGTVWYVAWGGGHALQLGSNGSINQTINITGGDVGMHYVLGFTVAARNQDCHNNLTALNVTLQDPRSVELRRVIYLQQNSSRNLWERHALLLGVLAGGDQVHIQIQSVALDTCWPILDAFTVTINELPAYINGNMVANEGFEVGPGFLKNSPDGILLKDEEEQNMSSLQEWIILGTVRYIDSSHYQVPGGNAAVELLAVLGDPSGVGKDLVFPLPPLTYMLNFTLGDANDSCVGDLIVFVQLGLIEHNFTVQSSGTGSAFQHSFTFKVEKSTHITSLNFYSFNDMRTRDGLLCGPVLDQVFLYGSYGERMQVCNEILIFSFFIAFAMLIVL